MRENAIEQYLVRQVKKELGGIAYKFTSPNRRHVPDRLLAIPFIMRDGSRGKGQLFLVEAKAPGEKPRAGQTREFNRLAALGVDVRVVDSKQAVDELISELKRVMQP